MDVHLRAKFEASSKVLTSFRQGVILMKTSTCLRENQSLKKKKQKRKNNIFEYINNDAKRNK